MELLRINVAIGVNDTNEAEDVLAAVKAAVTPFADPVAAATISASILVVVGGSGSVPLSNKAISPTQ
jgi:hypothetical protein